MDKAQAMYLHACLPDDSYCEFLILHVAHVYNTYDTNELAQLENTPGTT